MNEDRPPSTPNGPSWLERLSKSLLGEPADREQLMTLLRSAQQRNLLDLDALSMIEGVLQVSELQVRDIMVPRPQMVVFEEDSDLREMLALAVESGHSRFPVFSQRKDTVTGVALAKDLLRFVVNGQEDSFDLDDILREALVVPESKRLNVLLKEFRDSCQHMAIVIDEYGAIAGLVTIEDVLEQIVGEIDDEHDKSGAEQMVHKMKEGHYTIKALMPVDEFNEYFGANLDEEHFDTLGGLLSGKLGSVPRRGDEVDIDGYHFQVTKADSRRVQLLRMTTDNPVPDSDKTEAA